VFEMLLHLGMEPEKETVEKALVHLYKKLKAA